MSWDGNHVDGATIACMATFPERFACLPAVVGSLAKQVDWLFIYVNETLTGFPSLAEWPNVIILDSRKHAGDLSANGKIYPLRYARDCVVFTVDDDFIYPNNYVERALCVLYAFELHCCVTVHGSIFPEKVRWYYERQRTFAAQSPLDSVQLVTLAGSGTFAFHQSTLWIDPDDFLAETMVDLKLSLAARLQSIPIWCINRPAYWLRQIGVEGLWEKYLEKMTYHTFEARKHEWSFSSYREVALKALCRLERAGCRRERHRIRIDPALLLALETGDPPVPWRSGSARYKRRADYFDLLSKEI